MDTSESSSLPEGLGETSDHDLVARIRAGPDPIAVRLLWDRHQETIRRALRAHVYGGGVCPAGFSKDTFLDQCLSRAYISFPQRMRCFRFKTSIHGWLRRIANCVAIEELLYIKRQQREFDTRTPQLGEADNDPWPAEPLDEDQTCEFRSQYVTLRHRYAEDPFDAAASADRKRRFLELLKRHNDASDVDSESARVLRLRFWLGRTYAQIAEARYGPAWGQREENRRLKEVERTLDDDCAKLYELLSELGIRSSGDL